MLLRSKLGFALIMTTLMGACNLTQDVYHSPLSGMRAEALPGHDSRALAIGAKAPDLKLDGSNGSWQLQQALNTGPAFLIFYRGDW